MVKWRVRFFFSISESIEMYRKSMRKKLLDWKFQIIISIKKRNARWKCSIVQIQTNLRFIEMWNEEMNRFRFQSNQGKRVKQIREHKKMWPDKMIDIEEMTKENPIQSSLSPFHTVSSIEIWMLHSTELQSKEEEKIKHNKNKRYVQSYDNSDNSNDMNDDDSNEKNSNTHKLRVTSVKYDKKGILRWVTTMKWNGRKSHIEKTRHGQDKVVNRFCRTVCCRRISIWRYSQFFDISMFNTHQKNRKNEKATTALLLLAECTKTVYQVISRKMTTTTINMCTTKHSLIHNTIRFV